MRGTISADQFSESRVIGIAGITLSSGCYCLAICSASWRAPSAVLTSLRKNGCIPGQIAQAQQGRCIQSLAAIWRSGDMCDERHSSPELESGSSHENE